MNVAFLPVFANPYQRLLGDALAGYGINVEYLDDLPSARWLRDSRQQVAILHYHWLHGLYMARYATPFRTMRFIFRLHLARRLGYRIIWTAHNILPHNPVFPPLHVAIRRLMMRNADNVIVHCDAARQELVSRFPRTRPVEVIPIGSYAGVYPVTTTRAKARQFLGLNPQSFVYLFLGNIAAYKGLDRFVKVFGNAATHDDIALIAGRNRDQALVDRLRRAAASDKRIHLHAGDIPDENMQYYLLAGDVMVAPFERILSSSSVLVGLSYGLPVITPALGCLPELVRGDSGIIYNAGDPDALGDCLQEIKTRDLESMRTAARAVVAQLDWNDIGRRTADLYRSATRS